MRLIAVSAFLLIFQCAFAQAQELELRSGDHLNFSRLTIPISASQKWTAEQTPAGIEIFLPSFEGNFDTESVFTRMRRDRITGVTHLGETITLAVSCNCTASAFRSGSLLVIDVANHRKDLSTPPMSASLSPAKAERPVGNDTQFSWEQQSLPWIGELSPFDDVRTSKKKGTKIRDNGSVGIDLDSFRRERVEILGRTKQALVKEVGNAASIGLLDSRLVKPAQSAPVILKPIGPDHKRISSVYNDPTENLRISGSMDTLEQSRSIRADTTSSGHSCPEADLFRVGDWGTEDSFSIQIAAARNSLMDARDRLNFEAAKNLAKSYLYFGFGVEALSVLQLDASLIAEQRELADMSGILAKGGISQPNSLSHFTNCASDVALWAILSFDRIPAETILNTDAALLALNRLPPHLRRFIVPKLSDRLLQFGEADTAATAMRSVERISDSLSSEALMVQANINVDLGKSGEAYFEAVIEKNSEQSPEALIKLIQGKVERKEILAKEFISLANSYAQELRGTKLGNRMRETEILALSQVGRFREAFQALGEYSPALSHDGLRNLFEIVFTSLNYYEDDLTFLEHITNNQKIVINYLSKETRLKVAERLLDLGFASQAQEILASLSDTVRSTEEQLLAARAAILLKQPFQAQAALIGVDGSAAELLLAQAKELTGEYVEASVLFAKNGETERAVQSKWLSSDWQNLSASDLISFESARETDLWAADEAELGPLGRARSAVDQSSTVREALDTLLRNPSIQTPPDS